MEAVGIAILPLPLLLAASVVFGAWSAWLYRPEIKYFFWQKVLRQPPTVRHGNVSFQAGSPQVSANGAAKQTTLLQRCKSRLGAQPDDELWKVIAYWDETDISLVDNLTRSVYGKLKDKRFPKTMRNKKTGETKEVLHPDGRHWSNRRR